MKTPERIKYEVLMFKIDYLKWVTEYKWKSFYSKTLNYGK